MGKELNAIGGVLPYLNRIKLEFPRNESGKRRVVCDFSLGNHFARTRKQTYSPVRIILIPDITLRVFLANSESNLKRTHRTPPRIILRNLLVSRELRVCVCFWIGGGGEGGGNRAPQTGDLN